MKNISEKDSIFLHYAVLQQILPTVLLTTKFQAYLNCELKAKATVMKDLSDLLSKDMGHDMASMKKVTVASDSKEGLEKGLEKAKEVVQGGAADEMDHGDDESLESPEEEASESPEEAHMEGDDSPEAIQSKIKELQAKLAKHKK